MEREERTGDWKWGARAETTWCLPRFSTRAKMDDNATGRLDVSPGFFEKRLGHNAKAF
jgi:hypothetical protein